MFDILRTRNNCFRKKTGNASLIGVALQAYICMY